VATWKEIAETRRDPRRARKIARFLLRFHKDNLTEWELEFIEKVARRNVELDLSTSQSEKLLQVRDAQEKIESTRGFNVAAVLKQCWEARLDLDEDDEAWITRIYARSPSTVRQGESGGLLRIAGLLRIIEPEDG
jgi:hypothetical protein